MNVYSPVGCGIPDRAQNMVHMMNKSNWTVPYGVPAHVVRNGPELLFRFGKATVFRNLCRFMFWTIVFHDPEAMKNNNLCRWSHETHEDIDACVLVKDLSF